MQEVRGTGDKAWDLPKWKNTIANPTQYKDSRQLKSHSEINFKDMKFK